MKPPPQTAHVLANRIRMKSNNPGIPLLVEGGDDKNLYGRFIDDTRCWIQPGWGRDAVVGAISLLNQENRRIVGIVDRDFDTLNVRPRRTGNLMYTDHHDAEALMLASPALDHLLREYGDIIAIGQFEEASCTSVRDVLIIKASIFGRYRWLNDLASMKWKFVDFPFHDVVSKKTWEVDEDAVVDTLQQRSGQGAIDRVQIREYISQLRELNPDPWQLICGHDAVALLGIGLQRVLGQCKPSEVKVEQLERSLRLAYDNATFKRSVLYSELSSWEEHNVKILKHEV